MNVFQLFQSNTYNFILVYPCLNHFEHLTIQNLNMQTQMKKLLALLQMNGI